MDETAWLIELEAKPNAKPAWATVFRCKWAWTEDAFEAVRFARREDAELAARFIRLRVGDCRAVEHGFSSLKREE